MEEFYLKEETYKIIAPKWDSSTAILLPPLQPGQHQEIGLELTAYLKKTMNW
jgi:hypothetical protein